MKGLIKTAFLLSFLAVSLVGCKRNGASLSHSLKRSTQKITIDMMSDSGTLDPRKFRSLTDGIFIRMFMDGLTRVDREGNHILSVAKKVNVSSDKKVYTFILRESKWSNGDPVTSYDFAYAWKKSLSPDFNAPNVNMLYCIKNAQEAKTGKLPLSLIGIETPDETTLIITLKHPVPYFMSLTSHPIFFPVNRYVDRTNPQWADQEMTYVGNGPFIMSERKRHNVLEAKRNNHYWDRKAVKLTDIKMIMANPAAEIQMFDLKNLNCEEFSPSTSSIDAIPSLNNKEALHTAPVLATQWIRVNVEKTPFQNTKLRQALAYAIDRQAIINQTAQASQISTSIISPAMKLPTNPVFNDANVDSAIKLFNEALNALNINVKDFPEVTLLYVSDENNHLLAQSLQDQWMQAFGIQIELEAVESKVFFERMSKKDYILSLGNWFTDFNDPVHFLEIFKTKDIGTNNANWGHADDSRLSASSYLCHCPEERRALLARSEELLISEMPVIPIFYFTILDIKNEEPKNIVLTGMGNIDFKWAYLD